MRQAAPEVLFEDDDLRLTLRDTGSDLLVVGFSPMHWPQRGQPGRHWSDSVAAKAPFSWLAVDALRSHWFAPAKWERVAPTVRRTASRFAARVGFGHSMGAYAALRHSADYGASAILAFAPQCSIDPDEVGAFDIRYQADFDARLHRGMRLRPEHVDGQAFVFHDPTFEPDREHARRIEARGLARIRVTHMRHDVIHAAKGSVSVTYLVMRAVLQSPPPEAELHRFMRRAKKASAIYLANLAYKALRRGHARWAMALAARARAADPRHGPAALLHLQACMRLGLHDEARDALGSLALDALDDADAVMAARLLTTLGQHGRALGLLDRASIAGSRHPAHLRGLAEALLSDGQAHRALPLLERAAALAPDDPHCLAHLARGLMRAGDAGLRDPARAAGLLRRATALAPQAAPFWKSLAFALEADGQPHEAAAAWEAAARLGPLATADQARLQRLWAAPRAAGQAAASHA